MSAPMVQAKNKLFKKGLNKDMVKSMGLVGAGTLISELSWSQIDQEFQILESRITALEEIYEEEVLGAIDFMQNVQNSLYPVYGLILISCFVGVVILFRRVKKDDMITFLGKIAKIPDYVSRLKNSEMFSHGNMSPSAPYIHSIQNHANQRNGPYYGNAPYPTHDPMLNQHPPRNNNSNPDHVING